MSMPKMLYALTEMRGGGFRSECHVSPCFWWTDAVDQDEAFRLLRLHMRGYHQVEATKRRATASSW